jgi:hypothetical protein
VPPRLAISSAILFPIPLLAPVTKKDFPLQSTSRSVVLKFLHADSYPPLIIKNGYDDFLKMHFLKLLGIFTKAFGEPNGVAVKRHFM